MHNAVGIDVEGDLDLGHSTWRWWKIYQLELAEGLVVAGHLALALQHVDLNAWLHVFGGSEHLGTTGWDGGVALDELGHHATLGLDAEAQWSDVEQEHVFDIALEHASLNSGANGHDFVGVHALVWLFAGEADHKIVHRRHTRRATHQDHVVQLALAHVCIFERLLERNAATLDEVGSHLLELGASE